MGSTSSRHGSRPPTHPRPKKTLKRTLSSIFICGSSSSTLPNETENDSTQDCHDRGNPTKFQRPRKEISLPSRTEHRLTSPKSKNQVFLETNVVVAENPSPEASSRTDVDRRSSYSASTSNQDRPLADPNSSKERVEASFAQSHQVSEDRLADQNETPDKKVTVADSSSSESIDTSQETMASILGLSVPERVQEQRDETVRNDDVASVSSDTLSRATTEIDTRESRLDGRRLIWDSFLTENGGRHSDSQSLTLSSDDSDNSGSGDESIDGGSGGDSRSMLSRARNLTERRSRSEIWESIRHGSDGFPRRTGRCPSGLHSYGACSCEPPSMAQGRPRASLSRIVMLAETLFEVLDEIQRQPLSLPFNMVSLPAPDAVVDSLPVKNHKVKPTSENDIEQCQICLAEYEEGDEIKVLPCKHEYHVSCVDKWLKEIHRVCPLCRRNVCEAEAAV